MRTFLNALVVVFLAELADKTQLAVLGLASGNEQRWWVFLGGSLALILSTLIAVVAGDALGSFLPRKTLETLVGVLFIAIGCWFLLES